MANQELTTEVVVIGSGPGGYSAAFRAADLGKKVILVERYKQIGGVCLNVGCIPSKALLHAAKVLEDAKHMEECGIRFSKPQVDLAKLRAWKDSIVGRLTGGLVLLAKKRQVQIVQGLAEFSSAHQLVVQQGKETVTINFAQAIIAVGSRPVTLPFLPEDPRIFDSTAALQLAKTDSRLLVIGGGIIGLEMATVYHALGSQVTVVEMAEQLIPGADRDMVQPLHKWIEQRYEAILLKTRVTEVKATKTGLTAQFVGDNAPEKPQVYDQILCAVGRRPNSDLIAAAKAGVTIDERGFIPVDTQCRTNVPHIYAVGDVVGNPMLAHKAVPEGRVAAEVIAGKKHYFTPAAIPSVAYTDPELAWVGLTEKEAKQRGITVDKGLFPWAASGRSLSMGRSEGLTKLIVDPKTGRVLGAGIVGPNAGELIAELVLAIEMGCDAEDIALTIHPHPTLSETIMMSAEAFEGTITDLYLPKKDKVV